MKNQCVMPVVVDHEKILQKLYWAYPKNNIIDILERHIPDNVTIYPLQISEINTFLEKNITPRQCVISILPPGLYDIRVDFHFSLSRFYDSIEHLTKNQSMGRLQRNWGLLDEQKVALLRCLLAHSTKNELVIVDDGFASWSTVQSLIDMMPIDLLKNKKITILVAMNFSWSNQYNNLEINAFYTPSQPLFDALETRDLFPNITYSGASMLTDWKIRWHTYTTPAVAQGKTSIPGHKAEDYCVAVLEENIATHELLWLLWRKNIENMPRISQINQHTHQWPIITWLKNELNLLFASLQCK